MYILRNRLLKTLIPTLAGLIFSFSFIQLADIIYSHDRSLDPGHLDDKFIYILLVPIVIVALLFQFVVALPFWRRIRNEGKISGLKLISIITLFCTLSSLLFAVIIWNFRFGMVDLIESFLIGFTSFTVYWMGNVLSLILLDKLYDYN